MLGGETVPGVVRWLVNDGPFEIPGGSAIVNANAWNASLGYEVTAAPSMRMVVDLGDLDASTWINQTGVSGHPTADHYDDQVEDWVAGRQRPWPFSEAAVRDTDPDVLTLRPEGAAPRAEPEVGQASAVRTASTGWSCASRGRASSSAHQLPRVEHDDDRRARRAGGAARGRSSRRPAPAGCRTRSTASPGARTRSARATASRPRGVAAGRRRRRASRGRGPPG